MPTETKWPDEAVERLARRLYAERNLPSPWGDEQAGINWNGFREAAREHLDALSEHLVPVAELEEVRERLRRVESDLEECRDARFEEGCDECNSREEAAVKRAEQAEAKLQEVRAALQEVRAKLQEVRAALLNGAAVQAIAAALDSPPQPEQVEQCHRVEISFDPQEPARYRLLHPATGCDPGEGKPGTCWLDGWLENEGEPDALLRGTISVPVAGTEMVADHPLFHVADQPPSEVTEVRDLESNDVSSCEYCCAMQARDWQTIELAHLRCTCGRPSGVTEEEVEAAVEAEYDDWGTLGEAEREECRTAMRRALQAARRVSRGSGEGERR